MKPWLYINFILFNIFSCSSSEHVKENSTSPLKNYKIINFGEFHGTREMPELYFSMVRRYAVKNPKEIIGLGLEIPKTEERIIAKFLSTGDESHLKKSSFVTLEYQDGRASKAIIKNLKQLVGLGNIRVFCFDQNQPYTDARDKVMAINILKILENKNISKMFTYSGNLHPQKKIGTPWDKNYKSMGVYLSELSNNKVLAIRGEFAKGEAWICQGMTPDTCGVRKLGSIQSKKGLKNGLHFLDKPINGYDAIYQINSVTASRPWITKFK